jgi:hypothetical protein
LGSLFFHASLASAAILGQGQTLLAGSQICSDNNQYCLNLQASDGNLVLYGPTGPIWQSGTSGKGVARAVMQPDGNFVLYTASNQAVWSLNMGRANPYLNVRNDGNLAFYWYRAVWSSNTSDPNTVESNESRVLYVNTQIPAGSSYTIGQYFFILQADGNLVLYKNDAPIWASGTSGKGVTAAWMQSDGNFVLDNAAGTGVWATNTQNNPNAFFPFQPDGNLVVYTPTIIWDRLDGFNHPDYKDHSGPGSGICLCIGTIATIPF